MKYSIESKTYALLEFYNSIILRTVLGQHHEFGEKL